MSDGTTPPADDGDEAVEPEAEYRPYSFESWMEPDEMILGFCGSLKYMRGDGTVVVEHLNINLSPFESLGLHEVARRELLDQIELDTYAEGE